MPIIQFLGGPLDGMKSGLESEELLDDEVLWFDFEGAKCKYSYRVSLGDLTAKLESITTIVRDA